MRLVSAQDSRKITRMPRRKPFSGKQKKEQMKEKRQSKRDEGNSSDDEEEAANKKVGGSHKLPFEAPIFVREQPSAYKDKYVSRLSTKDT